MDLQAPRQGEVGRMLQVRYTVQATGDEQPNGQFRTGNFDGFTVQYRGQSSGMQSSSSYGGGRSYSQTVFFIQYTYSIIPTEAGTQTIPAGMFTYNGKTYKSKSATIQILPSSGNSSGSGQSAQDNQSGQGSQGSSAQQSRHTTPAAKQGKSAFFIVPTLSKQRIYEQEAVMLTYKIYTNSNISSLVSDEPRFDGLHVQEIDPNGQRYAKEEDYNGERYHSVVWKQYLLFPQQAGTITIPAVKYEALVSEVQQVSSGDELIDYYFGGRQLIQSVRREVSAPSVTLRVDSLPSPRPEGFTGAVGQFSISTQLTPQSLKANEATTMRVTVSGTGNLQLMRAPEVQWPKDFETYTPKTEEHTQLTSSGVTGNMIFDYIAVPRHEGKYDVAPITFVYFDPAARTYKTLHSDPASLDVARGEGRSQSAQEEVEEIGNDIRHIHSRSVHYVKDGQVFFGSSTYWLAYAAALCVFILVALGFRKYAAGNADVVGRRGRGASKIATKRLRTARKLMQQHRAAEFYDETMRALYGYISDKLNVPQSELNKDNLRQQLTDRNVSEELTNTFMQILDECEFARFAPGDPTSNMDKLYSAAESAINQMERTLKK